MFSKVSLFSGLNNLTDLTLLSAQAIYVFEFKLIELDTPAGDALAQIRQKGYCQKYLNRGRPVYLIGIDFSRAQRNIVGFEWAEVGR